jgi:hypothetical protein
MYKKTKKQEQFMTDVIANLGQDKKSKSSELGCNITMSTNCGANFEISISSS